MSQCAALGMFHQAFATNDMKRNAGASTPGRPDDRALRQLEFPNVETNVSAGSITAGPQSFSCRIHLLFARGIGWPPCSYEHLSATAAPARFVEEGQVPPDGQVIDTTWRYVNKSGGPDRRFNNNAQLPVMRYGDLLRIATGFEFCFRRAQPDCATRAASALNRL